MRLAYFVMLALLGVATAIVAMPNIALVAALYSFGIAVPLMPLIPSAFMALLCLMPVVITPRLWPLSAVAIAAAFYSPALMSDRTAKEIATELQAGDFTTGNTLQGGQLAGVEIRRPGKQNLNLRKSNWGREVCGDLCRRILHSGQTPWVRVHFTDQPLGANISTVVRGSGEGCAESLCFTFTDNIYEPADLVLALEETYTGPYDANRNPKGWAQSQGTRRLTATHKGAAIWQQTELHLFTIKQSPAKLYPATHGLTSGGNNGGLRFLRTRDRRNVIDAAAAVEAMGLNLAPAIATPAKPLSRSERKRLETIPPTPAQRQEIASLLERQGGLSDPAEQKISGWLLKARGASELSE